METLLALEVEPFSLYHVKRAPLVQEKWGFEWVC